MKSGSIKNCMLWNVEVVKYSLKNWPEKFAKSQKKLFVTDLGFSKAAI